MSDIINNWNKLADKPRIERTIESLKKNNMEAYSVKNKEEAKEKALSFIPSGAEIMTMSSVTLDQTGLANAINSGNFNSVIKKLYSEDSKKDKREMKKLGSAPQYSIGSFHAITENGEILIASNSGSQLPAYAYGSDNVIFVAGANKIVKSIDEGMKRIFEHSLPLESERAKIAYGVQGSNVSKILLISREITPGRIKVILVDEVLGF